MTITRAVSQSGSKGGGGGAEDHYQMACLSIQISPVDRALVISTNETDTPGADLDRDVGIAECTARIFIPELREERQWNHLAIVFNRALLKTSSVSVFLNGILIETSKVG